MKKTVFKIILLLSVIIVSNALTSCNQTKTKNAVEENQPDITTLEKEIELRVREYESYLEKGDSISLGNMYTVDAKIIPSVDGRENIVKVFSSMIKDSIIGSFETTNLWGNDELIVEEGKGVWSNKKGSYTNSGKYLLVWKKDDGKWKILRDTWFPDKKN